jgi:hypothetical protein
MRKMGFSVRPRTSLTSSKTPWTLIPFLRAASLARWITGPSPRGSE